MAFVECTGSLRWFLYMLVLVAAASAQTKPRIYSLNVYSDIKFHFATTLVTSQIRNPSTSPQEVVFEVTLPNQAFISNFTLEMGGVVYPAAVKEKEKAQKQYQRAKERGQSAGQVKQKPRETNRFKVEINVAAQEKVTFNLTYQEILDRRLGVYEHVVYIDPGQPVEELRVEVTIEENRDITYLHVPPLRNDLLSAVDVSARHDQAVINRPDSNRAVIRYAPSVRDQTLVSADGITGLFTVRYDVDRKLDGGDLLVVNGYFVHFFAPAVKEAVPKVVLFILDTSSSMSGRKIRQLKDAMLVILKDTTEGDRFAVMEFNTKASFWRKQLAPVTPRYIQEASNYIENLRSRGYTNMNDALVEGLRFLSKQNVTGNAMVVFLTDGVPSSGDTNKDRILANALKANQKEMPVYGLSFGDDADWTLVKKVTSQNNGVARRIYEDSDSSLQMTGFYKEVSTMLLTKVQAKYLDGTVDPDSLTQSSFKNYFNGSELVIAGKLLDNSVTSLAATMRASGKDGDLSLALSSNALDLGGVATSDLMSVEDLAGITEKMWAYLTLKQILKEQVGETDPAKKEELKQKAVELSLKYSFVTPVTSLVVTKPEEPDDVGDLDEDDSELQDDSSIAGGGGGGSVGGGGGGGGGGGYSYGGGGGDPHFMMELSTLPYLLCFDVNGFSGDVFRLLRDPRSQLTVNIEMGEGLRKRDHPVKDGSPYRVYIFRVAIIFGDVVVELSVDDLRVNEDRLQWHVYRLVRVPGAWLTVSGGGAARFVLDSGVEVDVKRRIHPIHTLLGSDFLDVEVLKEQLLSKDADGLLGQFARTNITLVRKKQKGNRMLGFLRSQTGDEIRHGKAFLKDRKDPYFNRTTPCLNLRLGKGVKLMGHPTEYYKVHHLFQV